MLEVILLDQSTNEHHQGSHIAKKGRRLQESEGFFWSIIGTNARTLDMKVFFQDPYEISTSYTSPDLLQIKLLDTSWLG